MSSDEKHPIAGNEAPQEVEQASGQDAFLTKEQFSEQLQRLTERAKAAGLNPIQTMVQTYARRGLMILNGILASLEIDDGSKKKK